jgi:Fe-S-cluster-containing dehydrogenase component
MDRRSFLKISSAGAVIASSAVQTAEARGNLPVSEEAVGMLYDATRCIGCRACVVECKTINNKDPEIVPGMDQWDQPQDLSADTLNIIKAYRDDEADEMSFVKRNCMHCVDASCVSVCPVKALSKDPVTGIVSYDADLCIGCRYCMTACPFHVPKYSYDEVFGEINKCNFCNADGINRIDKGELPGCAAVCPTGANIYGKRADLLEEAKRRLALKPGDRYVYKVGSIDSVYEQEGTVPDYVDHVYGEKELGGTQVLILAGVDHEKIGLPDYQERSYASISETVQHGIYKGFVAPTALFGSMLFLVHRAQKKAKEEHLEQKKHEEDHHE